MYGKIYFDTTDDFVSFLQKFTGKSTATFTARQTNQGERGEWVVEFEGGF